MVSRQVFGTVETTADERTEHSEAVGNVFEEVVSLYLRLRAASEDIHGHSGISGAMRSVLRNLRKHGPQTVPQIARRRPVTRQHIQAIVNDLQGAGLIEPVDNPAHKRSKLIQLTPSGEQALEEINAREATVVSRADVPVSVEDLETTRRVLATMRETLESDEWNQVIRDFFYGGGDPPRNRWVDDSKRRYAGQQGSSGS